MKLHGMIDFLKNEEKIIIDHLSLNLKGDEEIEDNLLLFLRILSNQY